MTHIPGLGEIPDSWRAERARWLLHRKQRAVRPSDKIVTAFRDGEVTLRERRRTEGFTNAIHEIGYQGIREGDLVVHAMDGFAGAIGVSDSDGKASPVVHTYRSAETSDARFIAYALRTMALSGYVTTLAKGIRERSTSFDAATLADVLLPAPPLEDQRRIADFLDVETARIDTLSKTYESAKSTISERAQFLIDALIDGIGDPVPLKYFVNFREGPGIMASDFEETGTPLIRVSGLQNGEVTLKGANYLSREKASAQWSKFRLKLGDYLISGSATMGAVSIVKDPSVVGAIPYTGLIILRPADPSVIMEYIATALRSSSFIRQIDLLKTGAAMQHFGPTHLAQVSLPIPERERQKGIASTAHEIGDQSAAATAAIDRQLSLLSERRQSLVFAAVTGQLDVTTAGRSATSGGAA
ncbi:restriction endonuclease subunit S [Streptomyces longispororuber]|uniref:restriction endonuclease subunit S n=1 Tax=Streptomyces longispororuber TaxID=68230 RepID=UPI0036F74719